VRFITLKIKSMKRQFTVAGICVVAMFATHAYLKPGLLGNTIVVLIVAAMIWSLVSAIFSQER